MGNVDIGIVRRLNDLLDSKRVVRKVSDARADQLAEERKELAAVAGRMEGKAKPQ